MHRVLLFLFFASSVFLELYLFTWNNLCFNINYSAFLLFFPYWTTTLNHYIESLHWTTVLNLHPKIIDYDFIFCKIDTSYSVRLILRIAYMIWQNYLHQSLTVSFSLFIIISLSLSLPPSLSIHLSQPLSLCISICISFFLDNHRSISVPLPICIFLSISTSLSLSLYSSLYLYF